MLDLLFLFLIRKEKSERLLYHCKRENVSNVTFWCWKKVIKKILSDTLKKLWTYARKAVKSSIDIPQHGRVSLLPVYSIQFKVIGIDESARVGFYANCRLASIFRMVEEE